MLIRPKAGILDPQGVAVERALPALGFAGVANVHVGRLVELDVEDEAQLDDMCRKLLANPLIEDYEIQAVEAARTRAQPDDGRAIPNFASQALRGEPLTVYGDGSQTRSLCYVDDLIEGVLRLLVSDATDPVNIGNQEEMTMLELAEAEKDAAAAREAALAKSLAESLGLDEAKVTSALQEIRSDEQSEHAAELKTRLDKAVGDGKLTQAEADAVTKAVQNGVIGGGGR